MLDISQMKVKRIHNSWTVDWAKQFVLYYKGKVYTAIAASSRIVFRVGKYAVKYDPCSSHSIRNEVALYSKIKKRDRIHFTTIYGYDLRKKIIVLRFVEFYNNAMCRTAKIRNLITNLTGTYYISDCYARSSNNWGICKKTGRPIIYDWEFNNHALI